MTTTQSPVAKEQTRPNGPPAALPKVADIVAAPASGLPDLPDLTALEDEALATLVEHGQAEILRRKQKREADFLSLVAETARTLGLSPARVAAAISNKSPRHRPAGGGDGRHDVKPVYRDPATGATWSGRGQASPFIAFGDEVSPKTGKPLP